MLHIIQKTTLIFSLYSIFVFYIFLMFWVQSSHLLNSFLVVLLQYNVDECFSCSWFIRSSIWVTLKSWIRAVSVRLSWGRCSIWSVHERMFDLWPSSLRCFFSVFSLAVSLQGSRAVRTAEVHGRCGLLELWDAGVWVYHRIQTLSANLATRSVVHSSHPSRHIKINRVFTWIQEQKKRF